MPIPNRLHKKAAQPKKSIHLHTLPIDYDNFRSEYAVSAYAVSVDKNQRKRKSKKTEQKRSNKPAAIHNEDAPKRKHSTDIWLLTFCKSFQILRAAFIYGDACVELFFFLHDKACAICAFRFGADTIC